MGERRRCSTTERKRPCSTASTTPSRAAPATTATAPRVPASPRRPRRPVANAPPRATAISRAVATVAVVAATPPEGIAYRWPAFGDSFRGLGSARLPLSHGIVPPEARCGRCGRSVRRPDLRVHEAVLDDERELRAHRECSRLEGARRRLARPRGDGHARPHRQHRGASAGRAREAPSVPFGFRAQRTPRERAPQAPGGGDDASGLPRSPAWCRVQGRPGDAVSLAEMIDAARARVEGAAATMGSTVMRVVRA